eukprot:Tbor_TRINITY_DN5729_c1_g1::TRINITY_DN5729_c1_g1_i6::g.19702::m.19702
MPNTNFRSSPRRRTWGAGSKPRAISSPLTADASGLGRGVIRRSKWESCFSSENSHKRNTVNIVINNDPFTDGVDVRSHNRGEKYDGYEIQNTGRNTERWMSVDRIYEDEMKNRQNVSMQLMFTLALGASQLEQPSEYQRQFSPNANNVINYSISQHTDDSPNQTVDRLSVVFSNNEDSISDHGGSPDISLENVSVRLMDLNSNNLDKINKGSDAQAGNRQGEILTDVISNDNGIEVYKKSETDDSGCNSILRNQYYTVLKSYVAQKNEELSIPSEYNTADPCSVRGSIESETRAPLKESTGKPKDMKIKKIHDTSSIEICNEDDEGLVYFEPSETEKLNAPSYSNTSQLGDGLSVDSVEVRNRSESDTIGEENNTIDGVIEGNNGILLPLAATEDLNDSKKRVDGRNIQRDSGHINECNSSDSDCHEFQNDNEIFTSLGLEIINQPPNESIKNITITSRRLPIKKDKSVGVEDRHLSMERREEIEDSLIDGYDERPIFNDLQIQLHTDRVNVASDGDDERNGSMLPSEDVTAPTEKLSKEDIRHVVEEILMEKEKREAAKITPQSRTHSHERAEASQFDFQSVLYESGGLDKSHDANMKGNSPSWHSTPARFHEGPVIQCERVQDANETYISILLKHSIGGCNDDEEASLPADISDISIYRDDGDIQEETHKDFVEVQLAQGHEVAMRSMQEEDMELQRIKEDEERIENMEGVSMTIDIRRKTSL